MAVPADTPPDEKGGMNGKKEKAKRNTSGQEAKEDDWTYTAQTDLDTPLDRTDGAMPVKRVQSKCMSVRTCRFLCKYVRM